MLKMKKVEQLRVQIDQNTPRDEGEAAMMLAQEMRAASIEISDAIDRLVLAVRDLQKS